MESHINRWFQTCVSEACSRIYVRHMSSLHVVLVHADCQLAACKIFLERLALEAI